MSKDTLSFEEKRALEQTQKKDRILQAAFAEFTSKFKPVSIDNSKATMKTTPELTPMFEEHTGIEIDRFDMADLMQQNQFTFKLIGDQFFWLMEEVA